MGLFTFTKPTKKITEYELTKEHILSRFDSVLSHHSASERNRRRAALHAALNQAMDSDRNMHHGEQGGIQEDEFERILKDLAHGGIISEEEARGLRLVAADPLRD